MSRPHRKWLVAGAALVVCGLPAGRATAGPVPSSFQPGYFTATSSLDWWVLGDRHCGRAQCLVIARTTNGGRSFTALPTPPSSTSNQATVGELAFANSRDGYAFGPELWSTHDGGHIWRQVQIGYTDAVATAGGYVYALVSNGGLDRLMRSPVDRDRWKVLRTNEVLTPSGVWAQGRRVIVQTQPRPLISNDLGIRFRAGGPLPVGTNCSFDSTAGMRILWSLCFRAAADPGGQLLRSANGGAAWTNVPVSESVQGPVQGFAAASASVAVVAGYQQLYRTTDGAVSWTPVSGLPGSFSAFYLGFIDATHGCAIGGVGRGRSSHEALYCTTDGGANYHLIPIGRL